MLGQAWTQSLLLDQSSVPCPGSMFSATVRSSAGRRAKRLATIQPTRLAPELTKLYVCLDVVDWKHLLGHLRGQPSPKLQSGSFGNSSLSQQRQYPFHRRPAKPQSCCRVERFAWTLQQTLSRGNTKKLWQKSILQFVESPNCPCLTHSLCRKGTCAIFILARLRANY